MKNNNYFDWVNYFFIGIMGALTLTVWAVFVALYPQSDTVMLFSLDRSVPRIKDIMTGSGTSIESQRYVAEVGLLDRCIMPRLYNKLLTVPDPLKFIDDNKGSGKGMMDMWARTDFTGWYRHALQGTDIVLDDFNLPYGVAGDPNTKTKGDPNLPPQHFLPLCRCFQAVLKKYGSYPDSAMNDQLPRAISAMNSCLRTRQLIPRQNFIRGDLDNSDIADKKTMSRSGFLLMIGLALLLNLVYRRWNINKEFKSPWEEGRITDQWIKKLIMFTLFFLIFFMPASFIVGPTQGSYLRFTGIFTAAGLAFLLIIEYAWMYQGSFYNDLKRHTYMHPFPFYITLTSLYMLALIENGVFTDENIYTYIWTSLGISCLYAGVIFSENKKLWMPEYGEASRTGYLLYIFLAGLSGVLRLVPHFPVASELNFLWVLPTCFAMFCFAGVVFVEHITSEDGDHTQDEIVDIAKFEETSHYVQLGHWAVLMLVLFYFLSVLVDLTMNDKLLLNANSAMNRLNFELFTLTPGNNYFEF